MNEEIINQIVRLVFAMDRKKTLKTHVCVESSRGGETKAFVVAFDNGLGRAYERCGGPTRDTEAALVQLRAEVRKDLAAIVKREEDELGIAKDVLADIPA